MIVLNFENVNKNLCVICDKHTITGKMTCSDYCHEEFIKYSEDKFGKVKKVVDQTTGIAYNVPTRDLIEIGLIWQDLPKYPQWIDEIDIV